MDSLHAWLFLGCLVGVILLPEEVCTLVPRRDEDGTLMIGPYRSKFRCPHNKYGYYADLDNGCQLFHICHPHTSDFRALGLKTNRMDHYSFICPEKTIFDQSTHICADVDHAVPCSFAIDFYFFTHNDSIADRPAEQDAVLEESTELRELFAQPTKDSLLGESLTVKNHQLNDAFERSSNTEVLDTRSSIVGSLSTNSSIQRDLETILNPDENNRQPNKSRRPVRRRNIQRRN